MYERCKKLLRSHHNIIIIIVIFVIQYPYIFAGVPKSDDKDKKIHEVLEFLEIFLGTSAWAAGDSITVADFVLVASISTFEVRLNIYFSLLYNISKEFCCIFPFSGTVRYKRDSFYFSGRRHRTEKILKHFQMVGKSQEQPCGIPRS